MNLEAIVRQLGAIAAERLSAALTREVLLQAAALVLALLLARLLQLIVGRTPDGVKRRLRDAPAGAEVLRVLDRVRLPITAWFLGALTLSVFEDLGVASGLLAWAVPFLALWFYYRLLVGLIEVGMAASQAAFWRRQVLRPLFLLVATLHATGLLEDILDWQLLTPRADLRVTIGTLLTGILIAVVFVVLARFARTYLEDQFLPNAGIDPALNQAISNIVSYAVILTGVLFGLSAVGIPLTMLTIIAGGLSVGLGFGLQEIVNNFVSGFILMFERSIGPGDVVRVGETHGVVQSIGVRSVMVRTRDNISLIVPNSQFLNDIVTNYTQSESLVRVHIEVGVSYASDPREVEDALLSAADHPRVLTVPAPTVRFDGFGDSSLDFALLVWTEDAQRLPRLRSELRYQIWDALQDRNIEVPFPQRDVHIRSGPDLSNEETSTPENTNDNPQE